MRINLYAEELLHDIDMVTASPTGHDNIFYGIRLYLHSSDKLEHSPLDDDRSAITFWVPWSDYGGHDFQLVEDVLRDMADQVKVIRLALATANAAGRTDNAPARS